MTRIGSPGLLPLAAERYSLLPNSEGHQMRSDTKRGRIFLHLPIIAGIVSAGHLCPAYSAVLHGEGIAAGLQCAADAINNDGVAVGTCIPASGSGAEVPWIALTAGTQTPLSTLAGGQPCSTNGIANNGVIIGSCTSASGNAFAVIWSASAPDHAPIALSPLPGLLGLLPDVSTGATGYNQVGAVMGVSINAAGVGTAVLWPNGNSTPIMVSSEGDSCVPADVNDTSSFAPPVALDCSNAAGTMTAKIARPTGLLGSYVATPLPIPSGSTYCTVSAINNNNQALGTCHNPAPDVPRAAFWPTFSSQPTTLNALSGNPRNVGMFLNNQGHVVFGYQDADGHGNVGFWNPSTNITTLIPPLTGGKQTSATAFGDNDLVLLVSENSAENGQAAEWTPSGGTVSSPV